MARMHVVWFVLSCPWSFDLHCTHSSRRISIRFLQCLIASIISYSSHPVLHVIHISLDFRFNFLIRLLFSSFSLPLPCFTISVSACNFMSSLLPFLCNLTNSALHLLHSLSQLISRSLHSVSDFMPFMPSVIFIRPGRHSMLSCSILMIVLTLLILPFSFLLHSSSFLLRVPCSLIISMTVVVAILAVVNLHSVAIRIHGETFSLSVSLKYILAREKLQ